MGFGGSYLNPDLLVNCQVNMRVKIYDEFLAVGVSLAMLGVGIWQPSVIIGVVTAAISLVGIAIGERVGRRWGAKVEAAGGVLLVLIGLRIFLVHG